MFLSHQPFLVISHITLGIYRPIKKSYHEVNPKTKVLGTFVLEGI
jgi:hypothetical protein